MIYLYVEEADECGEGTRASLIECKSKDHAEELFTVHSDREGTITVKMIMGSVVREWTPQDTSLPTSEEILDVSDLKGIDDIENKENV